MASCWKTPIPTDLADRYCLGNQFAATVLRELLCRARTQPGTFYSSKSGPILLDRGQAVCGREELCRCFGLRRTEQARVRSALDFLEKTAKQITKRKTKNGTIVSIIYFDEITSLTEPATRPRPNHDQTIATNKIVESSKSEKKAPLAVFEEDRTVHDFVIATIDRIVLEAGSLAPKRTDSLVASSVSTIKKLVTVDGFQLPYVQSVVLWALSDPFWSRNLLSLAGLRKKNTNGLMKFQVMAAQFDKDPVVLGRRAAVAREKALDAETRRAEAEMMPRPGVEAISPEEAKEILSAWRGQRIRVC